MVCYKEGKERGTWYEIQCLENDIKTKEARGVDASHEKKLLKYYKKQLAQGVEEVK